MRWFAAVLTLCLAASGCGRRSPLDYWFVDSLTKVFPDDSVGSNRVNDAAFHTARNAHVNIQLALRASQEVGDLSVDALPITGPGNPIASASVRWVEYVVVTSNTRDTPPEELVRKAPALFPDAVFDGFPITVSKNQTKSIWVTVKVPADQEPGEYRGQIRLRQGSEPLALIPYTLVVHNATVPDPIPLAIDNYFNFSEKHLQQFYGVSVYSDAWWALMRNIAGFMAGYHQNVIRVLPTRHVSADVRGGELHFDFRNFEPFVETWEAAGVTGLIDGGNLMRRERRRNAPVMVRAWVVRGNQAVREDIPLADTRAQRFLSAYLPALYRSLERLGWTHRYAQGILDEPHPGEREAFIKTARAVRRLMPGVRTIEPFGARQDLDYLKETTDIWVPALGTFDDKLALLREHTDRGGELWFYTALSPRGRYPNRFIDYSLLKVRLLHWINFKHDFRGFLHWGGNFWGPEPLKDTQPVINHGRTYLPPGDAYIVYPDRLRQSLYSSIRLEQMRAGIEDYGLLNELKKSDADRADRLAGEMVQTFTDYVRDAERFREIQRELLAAF